MCMLYILYIQYVNLCVSHSFSLGAIVVIWWSSQKQLALPVGSNLHSCVCCPYSDSSERRSVLALWPGCYQRVSTPQRGKAATKLLPCTLFSFFISVTLLGYCKRILHIPPISILRVFSLVWTGCARGWQNQGRWKEWKHIVWALTTIPLSLMYSRSIIL